MEISERVDYRSLKHPKKLLPDQPERQYASFSRRTRRPRRKWNGARYFGMEARRLIIWTTFFPDLFPDARSFLTAL
jgi:hypothetical protein